MKTIDIDFLKSKGGVYKQLLESFINISDIHGDLFSVFGAPVCILAQHENYHERVLVQRYGVDYIDLGVEILTEGQSKYCFITQREKKVLILGDDYQLRDDGSIWKKENNVTHFWLQEKERLKCDYMFFCRHEKNNVLLTEKSLRQRLLGKITDLFSI